MKLCLPVSFCIVLVSAIYGCAKEKDKKATVNMSVGTVSSGASLNLTSTNNDLEDNGRLSFTPTSAKLAFVAGSANNEATDTTMGPTGGGSKGFTVNFANKVVDLVGAGNLVDLVTGQVEIQEEMFGSYVIAGVQHAQTMLVSGSAGGETFTDLEVKLPNTGAGGMFATPVAVDADNQPTIRLVLSLTNSFYLTKNISNPNSGLLPDGVTRVVIDQLPMAVDIGAGNPTVKSYAIRPTTTAFGDSSKWYLRVVVFQNTAGDVVAVHWTNIYEGGSTDGEGFLNCGSFAVDITKNADSTYKFASPTTEKTWCTASRRLSFANFTLGAHDGTLTLGTTDYAYTATVE